MQLAGMEKPKWRKKALVAALVAPREAGGVFGMYARPTTVSIANCWQNSFFWQQRCTAECATDMPLRLSRAGRCKGFSRCNGDFFHAFLMLMGDASVCGGEILCKYYYIMC